MHDVQSLINKIKTNIYKRLPQIMYKLKSYFISCFIWNLNLAIVLMILFKYNIVFDKSKNTFLFVGTITIIYRNFKSYLG